MAVIAAAVVVAILMAGAIGFLIWAIASGLFTGGSGTSTPTPTPIPTPNYCVMSNANSCLYMYKSVCLPNNVATDIEPILCTQDMVDAITATIPVGAVQGTLPAVGEACTAEYNGSLFNPTAENVMTVGNSAFKDNQDVLAQLVVTQVSDGLVNSTFQFIKSTYNRDSDPYTQYCNPSDPTCDPEDDSFSIVYPQSASQNFTQTAAIRCQNGSPP